MTIEELIEAVKAKSVTKEAAESFELRAREREKRLSKESRRRAVSNEFMARSYNL